MKKIANHALRIWVWALGVFSLLPSSVYAQEVKDSIHGDVQHLDAVTVTARRMPAKISSATKCDLNLAFAYFVLHGIDSVAEHLQQ